MNGHIRGKQNKSSFISLTDFTLDDFRIDLLRYLETNRSILDAAPSGLYAVVPPHDQIKASAYEDLCTLFDQQTADGTSTTL